MAAEDRNGEVTAQARSTDRSATGDSSLDELAKGLASGTISRRKVLRWVGSALVGGVLASVPGVAWAAKPAPCPSGVKCGRNCCPNVSFACSKGKCACPPGTTLCNGNCADLQSDPNNCGSCGNTCPSGQQCRNGDCLDFCPAGDVYCCQCSYVAPDNPNVILASLCQSSTTCNSFDCSEFCQANTPPGMVQGGQGVGCHNQTTNPGQTVVCGPFPSVTGTICHNLPCSPTGS
jgi:hypothetical protein